MRRILFPAFGVVALLFAYAGQQLAAGAPSAPRASGKDPVALLEMGDAAKVLKHTAVAEEQLLAGLARADVRQRPLIKKLERQEAWVEREADKVLADEHKADQMLGGDRNAQPAQTTDPQALAATLADLQAQIEALEQQTKLAQMEKEAAELQSQVQSTQATIELVSNLVYAQLDMLRMIALLSPTSP
jgi:hypothetical protein